MSTIKSKYHVLQVTNDEYWSGRIVFKPGGGLRVRIGVESRETKKIHEATPVLREQWENTDDKETEQIRAQVLHLYPDAKLVEVNASFSVKELKQEPG